jgi:hypothetical protein
MKIRRRDLIQLGAGAAAGVALSPMPWNLIDDTTKWSQNWSWLPKVPRGERTVKQTRCVLCTGGCAIEAQCVAGVPVYLKGSEGPLCSWGLGGHHLAFHPDRLRHPNVPLDSAVAKIEDAVGKGACLVVDQRPGRAMSEIYRRFAAALPDGHYVAIPSRDGATLRAMERMVGIPAGSLGIDFDQLKTLIGIGTPLLDGWAAQNSVLARRRADPDFRILQVEARQSVTATAADRWIPARPGTEVRVALAECERLRANGPVLLIADGDACAGFDDSELDAVAAANWKLARGALTRRNKLPWESDTGVPLESIEDRSVRILILGDASNGDVIAWTEIERKLASGALIVSLSPYADPLAHRAHIRIPAFAAYEAAQDVPTPPYARDSSYEIAAALHPKPLGGISPADVLRRILPDLDADLDKVIKDRTASLKKAGVAITAPVPDGIAAREPGVVEAPALAVVSFGWRGTAAGLSTPLITKLYQESGLRPGSLLARMHPETAKAYGLRDRERAGIEVNGTIREKTVCTDPAVMPGVIEIADAIGSRWAPAAMRRIS